MNKDLRGNILRNKKIFDIFDIRSEKIKDSIIKRDRERYIEEELKCRLSE